MRENVTQGIYSKNDKLLVTEIKRSQQSTRLYYMAHVVMA